MISKFTVANGMTPQVKDAFRNRPRQVDGTDGFLRLEVLSPLDDPNEIWLATTWRDRQSFETWHHSEHYRNTHKSMPKGLKLVPKSVEIRYLEFITN